MATKRSNSALPPYVHVKTRKKTEDVYVLRLYLGDNEPRRSVILCPVTAPISQVWAEYEKRVSKNVKHLRWLLTEYEGSATFKKKANKTKTLQRSQIEHLCTYKMKSGKPFGEAEIKNITPGAIRKYLDSREAGGAPVAANREKSLMSAAWNWALERDMTNLPNPCSVVKRNQESPRTRYVTEHEYDTAYQLAEPTPYLRPAMELAYLCRMRRIEILGATRDQILPEGFDTQRVKGSRDAITSWTPRLTEAVNYKAGSIASMFIVHTKTGQKVGEEAFKSAWTRLKKRMVAAGVEPFNFHDLKAKGGSDYDGDILEATGHLDPKMRKVYDRKKPTVKSTK
jgi:integrase